MSAHPILLASGWSILVDLADDPRLERDEKSAIMLKVQSPPDNPSGGELDPQQEQMRSYIRPEHLQTLLDLLAAHAPSGSVDLKFPHGAPNWWVRLTRREPGEDAARLELRRLDPDSGVAEREAVSLTQPEADSLAQALATAAQGLRDQQAAREISLEEEY